MKRRPFGENRALYRRLLLDKDYVDARFDILSGGVSAVHKYHRFDQEIGPFGIKRGEYEKRAADILRRKGYVVLLESERAANGIKTPDGTLNGAVMDIKAVESTRKWVIKDKIYAATKQKANVLVLFFPTEALFSEDRITEGWQRYLESYDARRYPRTIHQIVCVVEDKRVIKKNCRGSSVFEGPRGQVVFLSPLRCKGRKISRNPK